MFVDFVVLTFGEENCITASAVSSNKRTSNSDLLSDTWISSIHFQQSSRLLDYLLKWASTHLIIVTHRLSLIFDRLWTFSSESVPSWTSQTYRSRMMRMTHVHEHLCHYDTRLDRRSVQNRLFDLVQRHTLQVDQGQQETRMMNKRRESHKEADVYHWSAHRWCFLSNDHPFEKRRDGPIWKCDWWCIDTVIPID